MPASLGRRVLQPVERALFKPDRLPDSLVTLLALAPPILAGLLLFKLRAAVFLAIAAGIGLAAILVARLLGARKPWTPMVAALIGTALVGPAAGYTWVGAIAAGAAALEVLRSRFLPGLGLQMGFVAYAAVVMLAGGDAVAAYINPGSGSSAADPVRQWLDSYGGRGLPVEDVRLYVGNVGGPVFATSLLAVIIGTAWGWYARRVSLIVLAGFLAGAMAPIALWRFPVAFSLNSGPLWFMAAFVLAQERSLPSNRIGQALLGLLAGAVALGLRHRQIGIEGVPVAIAGLQLLAGLIRGIAGLTRSGGDRKKQARHAAQADRRLAASNHRPQTLPEPPSARRPGLPASQQPPSVSWTRRPP